MTEGSAPDSRAWPPVAVSRNVPMVMRDGTTLAGDVVRPATSERLPAVLMRTPYGKGNHLAEARRFVAGGYAVVTQDVRGRGDSDGTFLAYVQESEDGHDTVEWVAAQPWCNGQVVMAGGSYRAWTQWAAARSRPPSLTAMVSTACCADWTGEWPWANGVLWPGAIQWLHMVSGRMVQPLAEYPINGRPDPTLPLADYQDQLGCRLEQAQQWLANPGPEYWRELTLNGEDFARIDVPVLHLTGWFDGCQRGAHALYEGMLAHSPAADRQRLVVGPWDHSILRNQSTYDGVSFGDHAQVDYFDLHLAWFDRFTERPRGDVSDAGARIFVTGRNDWAELATFPDPVARPWRLHLRGDGSVRSLSGDGPAGDEPADTYIYDPHDPTPTVEPGSSLGFPSLERSRIHARDDVLVYVSEPLDQAVLVSGRAMVTLAASSDAGDTDWFVEVVDLATDGAAFLVSHGHVGARFRHGLDREVPLEPGEVHRYQFDLVPRAHEFAQGHRIGVAVSSAGVPLWTANSNMPGDLMTRTGSRPATNMIHHDRDHGSYVDLPVVRGDDL